MKWRVRLGIVLLAHSLYLKLMVFTLPGTAQFFASIGLPAALAYIVFVIEAVAGWEYPLVLTVMALVQLSQGNGKYAVTS